MRMRIPEALGPEEEAALVGRMRRGDSSARAALIEGNLRTVSERVELPGGLVFVRVHDDRGVSPEGGKRDGEAEKPGDG